MSPTRCDRVLTFPFQCIESLSVDWSEDEDADASGAPPQNLGSALRKIKLLEKSLKKAKQNLVDYRQFVTKSLDVEGLAERVASTSVQDPIVPKRDDDSHYFTSYGSNGTLFENFPISEEADS